MMVMITEQAKAAKKKEPGISASGRKKAKGSNPLSVKKPKKRAGQ